MVVLSWTKDRTIHSIYKPFDEHGKGQLLPQLMPINRHSREGGNPVRKQIDRITATRYPLMKHHSA
jgi:hypothetical protein